MYKGGKPVADRWVSTVDFSGLLLAATGCSWLPHNNHKRQQRATTVGASFWTRHWMVTAFQVISSSGKWTIIINSSDDLVNIKQTNGLLWELYPVRDNWTSLTNEKVQINKLISLRFTYAERHLNSRSFCWIHHGTSMCGGGVRW